MSAEQQLNLMGPQLEASPDDQVQLPRKRRPRGSGAGRRGGSALQGRRPKARVDHFQDIPLRPIPETSQAAEPEIPNFFDMLAQDRDDETQGNSAVAETPKYSDSVDVLAEEIDAQNSIDQSQQRPSNAPSYQDSVDVLAEQVDANTERVAAEQGESDIEVERGLNQAEDIPGEEEMLRRKVEESLERLKNEQRRHHSTRKELGVFTRLAKKLGVRPDDAMAYAEAVESKKGLAFCEAAYANDLKQYLAHCKARLMAELDSDGGKVRIKNKAERERVLRTLLATKDIVPVTREVNGETQEIKVSVYEYFTSQQRQIVENKKESLDESERGLYQKLKDSLGRNLSKVWQEKLAVLRSADDMEHSALEALQENRSGSLESHMRKYRSKVESQKNVYEEFFLQPGDTLEDILLNRTHLPYEEANKMYLDFKMEAMRDLFNKGNGSWHVIKQDIKHSAKEIFAAKKGRRPYDLPQYKISPNDAVVYFYWRIKNLKVGEAVRIVQEGGKMKLKMPSFNQYYSSAEFQNSPEFIKHKKSELERKK